MIKLIVTTCDGAERAIEAEGGRSLMEVLRDNAVDDVLALCGGCCSCATCHVHVDPAFVALLPMMSADEKDLLDGSEQRTDASRLACQIVLTDALDGLRVSVVPND